MVAADLCAPRTGRPRVSLGARLCRAGSCADLRCLQPELVLAQVAHVVRELVVEVARVLGHLRLQAGQVRPHLCHTEYALRLHTRQSQQLLLKPKICGAATCAPCTSHTLSWPPHRQLSPRRGSQPCRCPFSCSPSRGCVRGLGPAPRQPCRETPPRQWPCTASRHKCLCKNGCLSCLSGSQERHAQVT